MANWREIIRLQQQTEKLAMVVLKEGNNRERLHSQIKKQLDKKYKKILIRPLAHEKKDKDAIKQWDNVVNKFIDDMLKIKENNIFRAIEEYKAELERLKEEFFRERLIKPGTEKEILSEKETATLLGMTQGALRQHRNRGTGPDFFRIGKKICYERGKIIESLRKKSKTGR